MLGWVQRIRSSEKLNSDPYKPHDNTMKRDIRNASNVDVTAWVTQGFLPHLQ